MPERLPQKVQTRRIVLPGVPKPNKHNLLLFKKDRDREKEREKNVRNNELGASTIGKQRTRSLAV